MKKIVEVRFKFDRRAYYSNPNDIPIYLNEYVIVQADKGADIGRVSAFNIFPEKINAKRFVIYDIIRKANKEDITALEKIREKEENAKKVFLNILINFPFNMKLIESEFQFDGNRLTFYFMSETRIDFRTFVRELAKEFRTRIELRQINSRQQMKYLGGIGRCGRELCCKKMNLYTSKANIQMAKLQNFTTTNSKITGLCGKTLCCLAFEQEVYEEKAKDFPLIGDFVKYENKNTRVVKNNYLKSEVVLADEDGMKSSITLDKYLNLLTRKEEPAQSKEKIQEKTRKNRKKSNYSNSEKDDSGHKQKQKKDNENVRHVKKYRKPPSKTPVTSTSKKSKTGEKRKKKFKRKFMRKPKTEKQKVGNILKKNSSKSDNTDNVKPQKKKKFTGKHFSSKKTLIFSKKNINRKNDHNSNERRD
ncbi:MAG: regulatory iron-sulfur-containing complex subunit RicT [Candidatus Cloacimonadota bacterium]|nr:regulatory iron-sulfur-containing complex subunit RicT [Candidatus Cloacimonadota bacterium]